MSIAIDPPDWVRRHLEPGETLLWWQSVPAWASVGGAVFVLVFSFSWAAFAFIAFGAVASTIGVQLLAGPWNWGALIALMPVSVTALFAAIGVALVIWSVRGFIRSFRAAYALTGQRLIMVQGAQALSYGSEHFGKTAVEGSAKRGDFLFAWSERGRHGPAFTQRLFGVGEPRQLERLVRQTLAPPV